MDRILIEKSVRDTSNGTQSFSFIPGVSGLIMETSATVDESHTFHELCVLDGQIYPS